MDTAPPAAPAKRSRRLLWVVPPLVLAVAAALAVNFWPHLAKHVPIAAPESVPEAEIKPHVIIPVATGRNHWRCAIRCRCATPP